MTDLLQAEPPAALLAALEQAVGPWLERCVVDTAVRQIGSCDDDLLDQAREMSASVTPRLIEQLRQVLGTDVDEQRANPLATLRAAVVHPGAVLSAAGVPPVSRDEFEQRSFPDDQYGLSPATWSDVDPLLHDPGILWGAWKAAVVLNRRRTEGRR